MKSFYSVTSVVLNNSHYNYPYFPLPNHLGRLVIPTPQKAVNPVNHQPPRKIEHLSGADIFAFNLDLTRRWTTLLPFTSFLSLFFLFPSDVSPCLLSAAVQHILAPNVDVSSYWGCWWSSSGHPNPVTSSSSSSFKDSIKMENTTIDRKRHR